MRERDYLLKNEDDKGVSYIGRSEPLRCINSLLLADINRRIVEKLGNDFFVCNPVRVDIYLDGNGARSIRYAIEHINTDPKTGENYESGIIGYVYTSDPYDPARTVIYDMTRKKMLLENLKYTQKFPFITEDIFLIATVDPSDKTEQLFFQKRDPSSNLREVFKEISCIHTEIIQSPDIQTKNEWDRITYAQEILDLNDIFFALKSWVQMISEMGLGAFQVIQDIEHTQSQYADITDFLIENMMLADLSFLNRYLNKVKRECKTESGYDLDRLRSGLDPVLRIINKVDFFDEYKGYLEVRGQIDHEFPLIPMTDDVYGMIIDFLLKLAKIDPEYLFIYKDKNFFESTRIPRFIVSNANFANMPEFRKIFSTKDVQLKESLIDNLEARKFPEWMVLYKSALTDKSSYLREKIARSPFMIDDPETIELYKNLFTDKEWGVRAAIARNPSAVRFPEYKVLFSDRHYIVRRNIVANQAARKFGEYNGLIPITDEMPYNHHWYKKTHYREYKHLFFDEYVQVRKQLAHCNTAVEFPEYLNLFNDSSDEVRYYVAENWLAPRLPEYQKLLNDPCPRVRESAKKHWEEKDKISINGKSIYEFHED